MWKIFVMVKLKRKNSKRAKKKYLPALWHMTALRIIDGDTGIECFKEKNLEVLKILLNIFKRLKKQYFYDWSQVHTQPINRNNGAEKWWKFQYFAQKGAYLYKVKLINARKWV